MATSVGMANRALILIGEEPIQSLDDDTAASNLYETIYQDALSDHPWTFAMKEQALSRNSQGPDDLTGYQYSFNLPSDLIRVDHVLPQSNYEIVGNGLNSNESELRMRYIYRVPESNLPAHFVKMLEYKLAADFAISVTENEERSAWAEQKFRAARSQARYIDSQGTPQIAIQHNPFSNPYYGSVYENRFK